MVEVPWEDGGGLIGGEQASRIQPAGMIGTRGS